MEAAVQHQEQEVTAGREQHEGVRGEEQSPPAGDGEDEEEEEEEGSPRALRPSFPLGRVKRIMKLDREVGRVNSEALFLISLSTDLFLGQLAEKAGEVAVLKRKRSVRVDHLWSAARSHLPTGDFLLDSLPPPSKPAIPPVPKAQKPLPPGVRHIDEFFRRSSSAAPE